MRFIARIMVNWYAVQAKNHHETRVVDRLSRNVVPTFLPLIEVVRRYRSRRVTHLEPLFPGYLFVKLPSMADDPGQWHLVQWTPGVKTILGSEGSPVTVPDEVVDEIKARMDGLGFVRPALPFAPEARVLIRRGPFAGLEAVFERQISASGRVQLLMQLLGQERRVQADALDLELA